MIFSWETFEKSTNGSTREQFWKEKMKTVFANAGDASPQYFDGCLLFFIPVCFEKNNKCFLQIEIKEEIFVSFSQNSFSVSQAEKILLAAAIFAKELSCAGYLISTEKEKCNWSCNKRDLISFSLGDYSWSIPKLFELDREVHLYRKPSGRRVFDIQLKEMVFTTMEAMADIFKKNGMTSECKMYDRQRILYAPKNQITRWELQNPFTEVNNTCADRLKQTSKRQQDKQLIMDALAEPSNVSGIDTGGLLKYIGQQHITKEICEMAVERYPKDIEFVPETYITEQLCEFAVKKDVSSLRFVPEKFRSFALCRFAVEHDECSKGRFSLLGCIPSFFSDEEKRELFLAAVSHNGLALAMIPRSLITRQLCYIAIEHPGKGEWDFPIHYVPKRLLTKKMIGASFCVSPRSLLFFPEEYVTKEMCLALMKEDGLCLGELPEKFQKDPNIIEIALQQNIEALDFLPEEDRKAVLCKYDNKMFSFCSLPDTYTDLKEKEKRIEDVVVLPTALSEKQGIQKSVMRRDLIHEITPNEYNNQTFYYVFDLHIEHQIDLHTTICDAKEKISNKISELVQTVNNGPGMLLIGGDVAYSTFLVKLFFTSLRQKWQGEIVYVLGNHELWNGMPEGGQLRSVDEVIDDYRNICKECGCILLENEVLFLIKNQQIILNEQEILDADIDEFTVLCKKANVILLGGIGFSGRNPVYNANAGLYRDTITPLEDKIRSERFWELHEKIRMCASEKKVVILTHMPVDNWMKNQSYGSGWVYLNGHTHSASICKTENGARVFADNQIGYNPCKWYLKSISFRQDSDPFENFKDGIYVVPWEDYLFFYENRFRLMQMKKQPGDILMLKREGVYLFLYKENENLFFYKVESD